MTKVKKISAGDKTSEGIFLCEDERNGDLWFYDPLSSYEFDMDSLPSWVGSTDFKRLCGHSLEEVSLIKRGVITGDRLVDMIVKCKYR